MKIFGAGLVLTSALLWGVPFSAEANDPNVARQLDRVQRLLSDDKFSQAAQLAKEITADNAEQQALHQRLLGYIYLHEGEYERAYTAYNNALDYRQLPDPLRKDVLGALVSLSMKRGMPDAAIRYAQWYLADYPPFQPVEQLYARALFSDQQYQLALTQANAIIARYPDAPEYIWQIKLLSEEQLNQNRALINTVRVIQDKFGADLRWQRKMAAAYARLGELRTAIDTLSNAAKQGTALIGEDYISLARYTALSGRPQQAIGWLDTAVEKGVMASDRVLLKRKLQIFMQAERWNDAWAIASELNRMPELDSLKLQATIASQLQRWAEAADLAQQAIAAGGDNDPVLWGILGHSALKTRQLALSRSAYQRLKKLDPNSDADVWLKTLDLMTNP